MNGKAKRLSLINIIEVVTPFIVAIVAVAVIAPGGSRFFVFCGRCSRPRSPGEVPSEFE